MSAASFIRDSWRKNSPELIGLFNGGLPSFVTASRPAGSIEGVPVFCYHTVVKDELEADLKYLASNSYSAISAAALLDYLDGKGARQDRAVLLSFDDGPRNFFDVAFPLLQRYSVCATAFIAPGLHADDFGKRQNCPDRPMSWREIETAWRSGLVDFQSHTLESRNVCNWPEPVPLAGVDPRIEREMRQPPRPLEADLAASRSLIETRLPGAKVEHLCFPMYDGTSAAIAASVATGFRGCYWGVLADSGLNRPGRSPYRIGRISGEFLRRLPGVGRASLAELIQIRLRRVATARRGRAQYARAIQA